MLLHHSTRGTASTAGVDNTRQIIARYRSHGGFTGTHIRIRALHHAGPLVQRQLPMLHGWLRLHGDDELGLR